MPEYRRILLDGSCVLIRREGDELVASEEVISTAFGGDREIRGIRPPVRA